MRYSWTQPCCVRCYSEKYPGRRPVRLIEAEAEECVWCSEATVDGIYIRINPEWAPHPTRVKEA